MPRRPPMADVVEVFVDFVGTGGFLERNSRACSRLMCAGANVYLLLLLGIPPNATSSWFGILFSRSPTSGEVQQVPECSAVSRNCFVTWHIGWWCKAKSGACASRVVSVRGPVKAEYSSGSLKILLWPDYDNTFIAKVQTNNGDVKENSRRLASHFL